MKRKRQSLFLFIFFLVTALLITYPAFKIGTFKTTIDGEIHFIKLLSIEDAFKHGELPPLVNFIGYRNIGTAFNGMYPWITSLIFIIPQVLLSKPVTALFIGFIILNILTQLNMYLLTRVLTKELLWRLLGVLVYELNTYHLTVMYARVALGEMLAYAFLPLVFLGCFQIWQKEARGSISLGLGLGMIVNAHVITGLYTCLIVGILCIPLRKMSWPELKLYILSGLIALLIASYTLYTMLSIMLYNNLITPFKNLGTTDPNQILQSLLANNISDIRAWNIGIVAAIIMIFMGSKVFKNISGQWKNWIIASYGLLFLTFSWFSYSKELRHSFLGNIQFTARLLTFVVLFLMIGTVLYLDRYGKTLSKQMTLSLATLALLGLGMLGVSAYHDNKTEGYSPIFYLSDKDYVATLTKGQDGWGDYMISKKKGKKEPVIDSNNINTHFLNDFSVKDQSYSGITFTFDLAKAKQVKLPFILYDHVAYTIKVNGKAITDFDQGHVLTLEAKRGTNNVQISSKAPKLSYVMFGISLLTIIWMSVVLGYLTWNYKEKIYE